MREIAHGIKILKRYGSFKTACWVLENNGEAAIVEMPPYSRGEKPPYRAADSYLRRNRIHLKYALVSHPHWDHCHTLPYFREMFPHTCFVAHESFLKDSYFWFVLKNSRTFWQNQWSGDVFRFFDVIFNGDVWRGNIGGEPLYVIHAPKHSHGDLLIIFKGAMITGDWYIGDLKDCNDLVSPALKIRSIDRVMEIVNSLNYNIHMLFSAHGDCLFYQADFFDIMNQSKRDHGRNQPNLKAVYRPGPGVRN